MTFLVCLTNSPCTNVLTIVLIILPSFMTGLVAHAKPTITQKSPARDSIRHNSTLEESNFTTELCHRPHDNSTTHKAKCSDRHAYCDSGKCRCRDGFYYNKLLAVCQLYIYHACTGDEECQLWDPEAYCDASLNFINVPVCDCKPGTLYVRRKNSCLPCPLYVANDRNAAINEDYSIYCSSHNDPSDPLRLRTPLRVILSAMTLIAILIVLYIFCFRIIEDLRSFLTKRQRTLSITHNNMPRGQNLHGVIGTDSLSSNYDASGIANLSPTPNSFQDYHFGASSITPTEFGTQCPSSASSITYQLPRFGINQIYLDPLPHTSVALLRAAMRGFDNPSAIPTFDPPPNYEEIVARDDAVPDYE